MSTCSECTVRINGFGYEEIDSCPLHAAAPEMLALLQRIAQEPCDHGAQPFCPREETRALLAKIEGA